MYVRIKTTPNSPRRSVQLVESIRHVDKVKQKIVRYIGIAQNEVEEAKLRELAELVKAQLEREYQPSFFSPEDMASMAIKARETKLQDKDKLKIDLKDYREEGRYIAGIHEVYGSIYKSVGFDRVIKNPERHVAFNSDLFNVVMARIANPQSKRQTSSMLEEDFGVTLPLERIYRMMDKLSDDEVSARIQTIVASHTASLLPKSIRVMFYDCTTLYFESFKPDELKELGYSKDGKHNQPQVILGLFVTEEGLPVGYDIFPGSTFEGHTMVPALEKLKKKFNLDKLVVVADSGMLNKENIESLKNSNIDYVVGARLKQLSKSYMDHLVQLAEYQQIGEDLFVKEFSWNDTKNKDDSRRLIVSWSKKRAIKDAHDRTKKIQQLVKKLEKSSRVKGLVAKAGYQRFLSLEGGDNARVVIDEAKVADAAKFDGLHGVFTNIQDLTATQILEQYHGLWQVEESFRITKHDLKVRPIYHWTPRRVKAHIAISFIAFCCIRFLTYQVALQYQKLSPQKIRTSLLHVQYSVIKHITQNKRFLIPSKIPNHATKIYQTVGLRLSNIPKSL